MPIRTDLEYRNGGLAVRETADTEHPLPELRRSDALAPGYSAVWKAEAGVESDFGLDAIGAAHDALARTFASLADARAARDPEQTQAQHLAGLARDYDRSLDSLAKQCERAQEAAQRRLADVEEDFRRSVKWNSADAAELRAVVRSMSPAERSTFIGEVIQSKDGQAMAAIFGGHYSASGLTAAQHRAYRTQAMHAHRPDLLKLEKALIKARTTTRQAFEDFLLSGDDLTAKGLRDRYAAKSEAARKARAGLQA